MTPNFLMVFIKCSWYLWSEYSDSSLLKEFNQQAKQKEKLFKVSHFHVSKQGLFKQSK